MWMSLGACILGFFLDLLFGDPYWMWFHPIRLIGHLIAYLEKVLRRCFKKSKSGEIMAGGILVVCVTGISFGIPAVLLFLCGRIHGILALAVESVLCYFIFATRSLKVESMKVYQALQEGSLADARYAVSMIVGRDTDCLDETGVAKAAVETVAENTSDGIIAPMCYMMLGGALLGLLYKSINTMDSMIGYKNETYRYFGRVAARLDDVANFIPARISALLMLLASWLLPEFDGKNAWKIYKRDRKKSASPNAAQTEAVCAGAMRSRILGDASYFGIVHHKETIGDAIEAVAPQKIIEVNRLLYATAFLGMLILGTLKWTVEWRVL